MQIGTACLTSEWENCLPQFGIARWDKELDCGEAKENEHGIIRLFAKQSFIFTVRTRAINLRCYSLQKSKKAHFWIRHTIAFMGSLFLIMILLLTTEGKKQASLVFSLPETPWTNVSCGPCHFKGLTTAKPFLFSLKSANEIHIITTDKSVLSSKINGLCIFFLSYVGLCRETTKENTHVEQHTHKENNQETLRMASGEDSLHTHVTFSLFVSGDYLHPQPVLLHIQDVQFI